MSSAPFSPARLRPGQPSTSRGLVVARSRRSWMRGSLATLVALGSGLAVGVALTGAALRNGEQVGAVFIGSWQLSPGEGTSDINPYQRAVLARTGAVPMTAGQGVTFTATRDKGGRKLDRRCSYAITGAVPRARFWTLAATDPDGYEIANPAQRFAFTSQDVLRDDGGGFVVVLSPQALPGNWLPLTGRGSFKLALRLYDSAVPGLGTRELRGLAVPSITSERCP